MKDGILRIQWIRSVDIGVNFALSGNDWRIRTWRGIPLFLHHGNVPKSPVGIIDCHRGLRLFGFLPPDSKSVTDRGCLAHVSFGGIAVGIVLGATAPLYYALVFSMIASIMIYELQSREILTGDASIAIFLTGMLAFGLVILRVSGGGITTDIEGYLFGNLLLIDSSDLNFITTVCIISLFALGAISQPLLAISVDPLAALIQGIPVRSIGLLFSVITASVVVMMVQVVGTLLVTALLVTPAATAQLVGKLQVLLAMDPVLWINISVDRLVPLS